MRSIITVEVEPSGLRIYGFILIQEVTPSSWIANSSTPTSWPAMNEAQPSPFACDLHSTPADDRAEVASGEDQILADHAEEAADDIAADRPISADKDRYKAILPASVNPIPLCCRSSHFVPRLTYSTLSRCCSSSQASAAL